MIVGCEGIGRNRKMRPTINKDNRQKIMNLLGNKLEFVMLFPIETAFMNGKHIILKVNIFKIIICNLLKKYSKNLPSFPEK